MKKVTIDNNSLAHTSWNCKYHIVFATLFFCVVKRYDPKSLKIIKIWLYMRLEALERSRRRSEKASKRGAALKPPASP